MNYAPSKAVTEIRSRLDHPVIDGDGHHIEYMPYVRDLLAEDAGSDLVEKFDQLMLGSTLSRQVPLESRRAVGITRMPWWAVPSRNTLDRATALLPNLLYDRLEEFGIDYALLYPTFGLAVTVHQDDEFRPALARAFNRYSAEVFSGLRDRLEPVAAIPMSTPEEAVAELDHAVGELGLKAVMMAGIVTRPVPGSDNLRAARYIDSLGHDSLYDYSPVWEKCEELKVSPTFHAASQGLGTRVSRTNYVYNHIGNFAAAGEAAARSLFFGGVPYRHKSLRFAFLEGGVAWGANLLADIIGHYEKRNIESLQHYNPANLDRTQLAELVQKFGTDEIIDRMSQLDDAFIALSDPGELPEGLDEFAESCVNSVQDIVDIFTDQYFFGCEADDPMNAVGFNASLMPGGETLGAIFASDIGHWDVTDMKEVLLEAYELVEDGHLTETHFKDFTFGNAVRLWAGTNPDFFNNTAVETAAKEVAL